MTKDCFMERLEKMHFQELLFFFLPEEYKWKVDSSLEGMHFSLGSVQKSLLIDSFLEESQRDWAMAEKTIQKGNVTKG